MSFNIIANNRNIFTRKALKLRFEKMEAKKSLDRALVLGLLLFGLWVTGYVSNIWLQIIFLAFGICFLLNVLSFILIFVQLLFKKPLYGSERQQELLNLKETVPLIRPLPKIPAIPKGNNSPQFVGFISLEKHNHQPILASTPKKSYTPRIQRKFKTKMQQEDFIADERSLQAYLSAYEKAQQTKSLDYHFLKQSNAHTRAAKLLQTSVYQLAADNKHLSPPLITNNGNNLQTEILAHMSFEQLTLYVLKLRHWIAITILKPLVNEIDDINATFERVHLSEFKIGFTSLEQLCNLVNQTQLVSEHAPRLPMVMAYLKICSNQIYLLDRLRSLASGDWLSSYTCKMMTSINFRNLPNDAAIIFQCLCHYLDRQMLSLAQDGAMCQQRIFYDNYVIPNVGQYPIKQLHTLVRNHAGCALLWTDSIRPKFNLITNDKLYYGQYGFNNLFHVFLGFLTYMKRNNNGMLEYVSLGSNGINILQVIGEMD